MKPFEIVIPCKGLAAGKSRLADVLTPLERERLCRRLLSRTIAVAVEAAAAGNVTVVSADAQARALARRRGAGVVDDRGGGLNAALAQANRESRRIVSHSLVVLPIDLPMVTAELLRAAVEQVSAVGIAPDVAGAGTNLLVLSPAARRGFGFAFGADSFRLHREGARISGHAVVVLSHANLAFDLDRPPDLSALLAQAGTGAGHA